MEIFSIILICLYLIICMCLMIRPMYCIVYKQLVLLNRALDVADVFNTTEIHLNDCNKRYMVYNRRKERNLI